MWVHSYTRPLWYIWNEWQFNITKTLFAESIRTFIDRWEGRFLFFWCYVMCLTVMWCDYWDVGEEEIVSGHFLCSGFRRCLVSVNDDGISPHHEKVATGWFIVYDDDIWVWMQQTNNKWVEVPRRSVELYAGSGKCSKTNRIFCGGADTHSHSCKN